MKKWMTGIMLGAVVMSMGTTTFATSVEETSVATKISKQGMRKSMGDKGPQGAGQRLEEKAAEAGMSVEAYKQQRQAECEAKAAELGMTIEEYRASLKGNRANRKADLEAAAEEAGMTLEEYKASLGQEHMARREAYLAQKAEEAGMSVEEYKEQLEEQRKVGRGNGVGRHKGE